MDALLQITTFELGRGARDGWTSALVSVVETVIVTIASPGLRDTRAAAHTRELEVFTRLDTATVSFICRVSTVILSVTLPGQGDASSIAALEL